jgi:hypothetical protein
MGRNINDFKGDWHIWWVQGFEPILKKAWKIAIGTGADGAQPPFLSYTGEVCAGFAIYETTGDESWKLYASSVEWGPMVLVDGHLRWAGNDKDGEPLRIYMSLAEGLSESGPFTSMYGSTLRGDPDQVAVWGANDGPPRPDPV